MTQPVLDLIAYGTAEPSETAREFVAGALTFHLVDGAIRHLCWHGIEVVRGIACPIRDADWATHASVLIDETMTSSPEALEITQARLIADGALRLTLQFKASADGHFRAMAEISASREVLTNRAGFTLLHPLRGVAGTALRVTHPDRSVTASHFPLLISPHQVAGAISGLRHSVRGIDIEILLRGEVFEMEDQRNWSDASFKTYCRPLSLPRPYRLQAGDIVRQEIQIAVRETSSAISPAPRKSATALLDLTAGAETVPRLAVAMEEGALPDARAQRICRLLKPAILQLRVTPETAPLVCQSAAALLAGRPAEIELEIVVPTADDPQTALARVATACQASSHAVARVLALPEKYLHSYQPAGPWPAGSAPQAPYESVRAAFPGAQVGGGMLTYFTELNRCRPGPCDYVLHGSTAITHAADDGSVMESLEGLSHVFASGRALAGARDYRLGLVAIGMRSNPYGAAVVENIQQRRIAMAGADPRQRGLFAAAWAVGAVAATHGHGVSSMALSAFVGPFGVIHRPEAWPQPLYDGADMVYPLFHVVRFLAAMGGAARLSLAGMEESVVGVGAAGPSETRLLLANLGAGACHMQLAHRAEIRTLDAESFAAAIRNPAWLDESDARQGAEVMLNPFSVAFLTMPRAG